MKSDLIVHIIQTKIQNYILITRQDKPTGWMLLFIPCLFGIFSASIHKNLPIDLKVIILFLIGSILMRSAGCIFNDIVDRDIDAKVERTKNRPLANKSMSLYEAIFLLLTLLIFSFLILISLNKLTIILGFASIILVVLYPFMKRITYWPQLFLGFTFNWGAIVGWTAISNSINIEMFIIYISSIFWTLGYDTVYGYQDIKDDKVIGVKSTSVLFEPYSKNVIWLFYFLSFSVMSYALFSLKVANISVIFFIATVIFSLYLIRKLNLRDVHSCGNFFSKNKYIGFLIAISIALSI